MNQTTNDILELLRKSDNPISDPEQLPFFQKI